MKTFKSNLKKLTLYLYLLQTKVKMIINSNPMVYMNIQADTPLASEGSVLKSVNHLTYVKPAYKENQRGSVVKILSIRQKT